MVIHIDIPRVEAAALSRAPGWTLLYGRRKVGKTYLIRKMFECEMYVLVKRGGGALMENAPLSNTDDIGLVMDLISEALMKDETVIVDEFHRLPDEFLDRMQLVHPRGRLVLLGSSFHLSRRIMSKGSPVLGLFSAVRLSLADPVDILSALSDHLPPDVAVSLSPFMRDPWTLRFAGNDTVGSLKDVLEFSGEAIPALLGEVFLEEDRFLSQIYEGIIRSIARGRTTMAQISDVLHSMKLIDRSDPSRIRQYVLNMEAMDLIERTPVFQGKGNRYTLRSKIMELHYYLEEKYGTWRDPPLPMEDVIRDRIPHAVEAFVGDLLAAVLEGTYRYQIFKDREIDIIITRHNRPVLVGEVKWGSKVSKREIDRFIEIASPFDCRKVIVTKNPIGSSEIENLTPTDLIKMAKEKAGS
ncbi:MAG: hypothetical protein QCI82_09295 [Candidatus Thermoplasmatota archaeon]|nr:hypothetical protein [Candidatus Thermoplasmatota archaeon]